MAFPVTLNGRTYTLADFEGTNYVDGLPDAFEDFVTHAGDIYNSTSTSSVAIGTGSKTFTTADSGKPYQAGTPLRIADAAAPETNFLDCIVTSYSGTTLVVDVFGFAGSGTKTSWTINIGGAKTVDGTLAIAQGGTGATSAADARTNIDVYSKSEADSKFLDVSGEASNVTMTGDVTIGDTAGDTLTVNAAATFVNGVSFGDNVISGDDIDGGTISNFASTGIDDNATSTAITIDSSENIGIGEISPGRTLDVNCGAANIVARFASTDFTSGIVLEDDDGTPASVVLNCEVGSLTIDVDGGANGASPTEAMRIRENGQLLYGGTTNSPANVRMVVFGTGNASKVFDSGHTGIHINNENATAGDGNFGAGLSFGRFGSSSDDQSAAIVPVQTTSDEDRTGIAFFIHNTNTRANPLVEKMRITENGVHFSGNTSSDTGLDDYEEGTWDPVFTSASTDPTITYDRNDGFYVKIGRKVYARLEIRTDSVSGGSGTLLVSGLPFTSVSGNGARAGGMVVHYTSGWSGDAPLSAYMNDGTNEVILLTLDSATAQGAESDHSIDVSDLNTGSNANYLMAEIVYEAA